MDIEEKVRRAVDKLVGAASDENPVIRKKPSPKIRQRRRPYRPSPIRASKKEYDNPLSKYGTLPVKPD